MTNPSLQLTGFTGGDNYAAESQLRLSVVICSRNGAETLPRALRSLHSQSVDPSLFEVIVVDDNSEDSTAGVAISAGVRVLRTDTPRGISAARNLGWRAARAPFVAYLDDDCEADRDWVRAVLDCFADPAVDGVGGKIMPECENRFIRGFLRAYNPLKPLGDELSGGRSLVQRALAYGRSQIIDDEPSSRLYAMAGANMAFRSSAMETVNGFDERIRFSPEDEDLCRRLGMREGGGVLRYAPSAIVTHWFRSTLRDALRRARAYGHGTMVLSQRYREVNPIVFPVPCASAILAITSCIKPLRRKSIVGLTALPLAGYPRWIVICVQTRKIESVLYPYMLMLTELCTMIGEFEEVLASGATKNT